MSAKRRQLDARGTVERDFCFSQANGLFCVSEMLFGETDMGKVIDYIKLAPDGFFLYLTHSYSRNDTKHSYYNLKFVFALIDSF